MAIAFPETHSFLLSGHGDSFCRLFGGCHPDPEIIKDFESALEHEQSRLQQLLPKTAKNDFGLWGQAGLILRSAAKLCPESSSSCGAPTLSQVYLELVHQFVLLNEVLFRDVVAAVTECEPAQHSARRILPMFDINEINHDNSGRSKKENDKPVKVIENIRNAFAHGKARIVITGKSKNPEPATLEYDGSLDRFGPNIKSRPIEDISVLGTLMQSFTLSVT
jgi:hypothetical protein